MASNFAVDYCSKCERFEPPTKIVFSDSTNTLIRKRVSVCCSANIISSPIIPVAPAYIFCKACDSLVPDPHTCTKGTGTGDDQLELDYGGGTIFDEPGFDDEEPTNPSPARCFCFGPPLPDCPVHGRK